MQVHIGSEMGDGPSGKMALQGALHTGGVGNPRGLSRGWGTAVAIAVIAVAVTVPVMVVVEPTAIAVPVTRVEAFSIVARHDPARARLGEPQERW